MQFSVEFDFVTVFDVFLSGYEKARKNGGSSYGERTVIVAIACCVIFIKSRFSKLHKPASQHRIAIIIPYLSSNGPYLQTYMGIFLQSAAGSKDIVDFLIFHNGQLRPSLDD